MRYSIVLALLLVVNTTNVFGQRDEFGFQAGAMNYQGELSEYLNYQSPSFTAGAFFRQNWNEAVSTRYSFAIGQIRESDTAEDDLFAQQRNHSFNNTIVEVAIQAEYNFFHFRNPTQPQLWTPYIFGGIAGFKMSPEASSPNYSLYQIALPFGVGMKFVAGENWNIGLDFGARKTFTDFLDDVEVRQGRDPRYYEGNPYDRDWYFSTNITVSYTIYTKPCPRFYKF
ncbi:MAG: DUF6089 family protein [Thermonemataceae bacterium]